MSITLQAIMIFTAVVSCERISNSVLVVVNTFHSNRTVAMSDHPQAQLNFRRILSFKRMFSNGLYIVLFFKCIHG